MSRIAALKQFLEEDPSDSFSRYALAMEYARLERYDDAIAEYRAVISNDPDYVASYYQLGKVLEHKGRIDDARATYESGIEVAERQGDAHTRDELAAALDGLE